MQWLPGGDEVYSSAAQRLMLSFSGTINTNISATAVYSLRIDILPGGGLKDASNSSQAARTYASVVVGGTWGEASQPLFLSQASQIGVAYCS